MVLPGIASHSPLAQSSGAVCANSSGVSCINGTATKSRTGSGKTSADISLTFLAKALKIS